MIADEKEWSKDIEELAVGFADILGPSGSVHAITDSRDLMDTVAGILDLVEKVSAFVINYISMTQTGKWYSPSGISKVSDSNMVCNRP